MNQTLRIVVEGRVQGVFYRASAQREARRLSLTGYARNLPEGCVEIVVTGQPAVLHTFLAWCRQGPPRARVTDVNAAPYAHTEALQDFEVR